MTYKALVISEQNGSYSHEIKELPLSNLKDDELLVKVHYSALNYKDALSFSGNKGVSKNYPHTPGIDGAGTVEDSKVGGFKKGDRVLVSGFDLGMNTNGALAEYICVPSSWAFKLPKHISLELAASYGTAAMTAIIGLEKLLTNGINPCKDRLVVTGATGAVGVFVLAMANKIGFKVDAISGKNDKFDLLKLIGADKIHSRDFIDTTSSKLLLKPYIDAAFDTVGGGVLSAILKGIKPYGSVATCGNVAGLELNTTVFPFILNGINLLGISSAGCDKIHKDKMWEKAFDKYFIDSSAFYTVHTLEETPKLLQDMLDGKSSGRKVIRL